MIESRHWFVLVLSAGLIWLMNRLSPVITPFAIAAGLAYLGDPIVDRLEKLKFIKWDVSRGMAVTLVFSMMVFVMLMTLLFLVPMLSRQFSYLAERVPAIFNWLVDTGIPWVQSRLGLESLVFDAESVKQAIRTYWKEASMAAVGVLDRVSAGSQVVLGWFMSLLLIPVVTFYLLRDWDKLVEGIRTLLPRKSEPTISRLAGEIDEVIGAFMRGQLLVMIALGVIYTLGLLLLGLDLAIVIGMVAGLLSIVPYLGTIVGVVAALLAAIFQFQDIFHPLMVLLVFGVGQALEGMVLTPKLVGDQVGLHPVAVIFAVLAGGQLFGFLGVLLALPVAAGLNVLVRYAHGQYTGSSLYDDGPRQPEGDG